MKKNVVLYVCIFVMFLLIIYLLTNHSELIECSGAIADTETLKKLGQPILEGGERMGIYGGGKLQQILGIHPINSSTNVYSELTPEELTSYRSGFGNTEGWKGGTVKPSNVESATDYQNKLEIWKKTLRGNHWNNLILENQKLWLSEVNFQWRLEEMNTAASKSKLAGPGPEYSPVQRDALAAFKDAEKKSNWTFTDRDYNPETGDIYASSKLNGPRDYELSGGVSEGGGTTVSGQHTSGTSSSGTFDFPDPDETGGGVPAPQPTHGDENPDHIPAFRVRPISQWWDVDQRYEQLLAWEKEGKIAAPAHTIDTWANWMRPPRAQEMEQWHRHLTINLLKNLSNIGGEGRPVVVEYAYLKILTELTNKVKDEASSERISRIIAGNQILDIIEFHVSSTSLDLSGDHAITEQYKRFTSFRTSAWRRVKPDDPSIEGRVKKPQPLENLLEHVMGNIKSTTSELGGAAADMDRDLEGEESYFRDLLGESGVAKVKAFRLEPPVGSRYIKLDKMQQYGFNTPRADGKILDVTTAQDFDGLSDKELGLLYIRLLRNPLPEPVGYFSVRNSMLDSIEELLDYKAMHQGHIDGTAFHGAHYLNPDFTIDQEFTTMKSRRAHMASPEWKQQHPHYGIRPSKWHGSPTGSGVQDPRINGGSKVSYFNPRALYQHPAVPKGFAGQRDSHFLGGGGGGDLDTQAAQDQTTSFWKSAWSKFTGK